MESDQFLKGDTEGTGFSVEHKTKRETYIVVPDTRFREFEDSFSLSKFINKHRSK